MFIAQAPIRWEEYVSPLQAERAGIKEHRRSDWNNLLALTEHIFLSRSLQTDHDLLSEHVKQAGWNMTASSSTTSSFAGTASSSGTCLADLVVPFQAHKALGARFWRKPNITAATVEEFVESANNDPRCMWSPFSFQDAVTVYLRYIFWARYDRFPRPRVDTEDGNDDNGWVRAILQAVNRPVTDDFFYPDGEKGRFIRAIQAIQNFSGIEFTFFAHPETTFEFGMPDLIAALAEEVETEMDGYRPWGGIRRVLRAVLVLQPDRITEFVSGLKHHPNWEDMVLALSQDSAQSTRPLFPYQLEFCNLIKAAKAAEPKL